MFLFLKPIFSFLKKAFLVVAVYFIVISLFSHFIGRDKVSLSSGSDPIKQNRTEIYKVINDKELNKTKEGKLTVALYKMSMCSMIGEACTNNPNDADKNYGKSVFGFMSNLIIIPYANPPASGVMWAYEGLQNAGFVPKTMAAEGIGFAAIKPFASLWKIFRDLSYMLLVIILIAIGFMIMFRAKINPQTVISVENALPKIVISLILITFSFAIAGFIIDLMYITIGLIVSILIKDPAQATQYKNEYMMASGKDLFRDIRVRFGSRSIGAALGSAFTQIVPLPVYLTLRTAGGVLFVFLMKWVIEFVVDHGGSILGFENAQVATFGIGALLKSFFSLTLFPVVFILVFFIGFIFAIPWIVSLLIGFSILFLFFRILFILFTSYLKLIINIIVAPLLLLFEAVPGKSAFKYWFMNIIGCLIPFPVIIFVFLLGYLIIFQTNSSDMTARLPYLYGIDSNSFRLLIGVGIIFLIPDFIKTIKEALGIKELPFNIGVGTFFGGVAAGVGGATGLLGQVGSISLGLQAFSGEGGIGKFINRFKGQHGEKVTDPTNLKNKE